MKKILYITSGILIIATSIIAQQKDFSKLTGPYLGQKPPDDTPIVFASNVIPDIGSEHTATVFTPDGKEAFWSRIINPGQSPRLIVTMHIKQKNGVWSQPELAPFNMGLLTLIKNISPDGKRLYIHSWRPYKDENKRPQIGGWVVDKNEYGWGEPRIHNWDLEFEGEYDFQQEVRSGNLYLRRKLKKDDRASSLFRSKLVHGKYQKPKLLGESINSKYMDYSFCIDPNEAFIIFASNRPGVSTQIELYISFHMSDDTWSDAYNLGPKIKSVCEGGTDWPCLSPNGKYLFFLGSVEAYKEFDVEKSTYKKLKAISQRIENGYSRIYWVSTRFIEELKPDYLK